MQFSESNIQYQQFSMVLCTNLKMGDVIGYWFLHVGPFTHIGIRKLSGELDLLALDLF